VENDFLFQIFAIYRPSLSMVKLISKSLFFSFQLSLQMSPHHDRTTDNVDDDVERNLRKEREINLASLAILEKLHVESVEQIRKLRASIYLLDRDLENKESSLQIDQQNLVLRENQIDMKVYEGNMNLDP
jgi:Tektin family